LEVLFFAFEMIYYLPTTRKRQGTNYRPTQHVRQHKIPSRNAHA
jgi:hypothetical protein